MRYHLTRKSGNGKLGPISTTITSPESCPDSCPLKAGGCYAKTGPLSVHWQNMAKGQAGDPHWAVGTDLQRHCQAIRKLDPGSMIRLNQAGDLPGNGKRIDRKAAIQLARACRGLIAWTYTHYRDLRAVRRLNAEGLTVNVSANNPRGLDRFPVDVPAVTLLPGTDKVGYSPKGRRIVRCPAEYSNLTCRDCGAGRPLCYRQDRNYAIGFTAHGIGKAKAQAVAEGMSFKARAAIRRRRIARLIQSLQKAGKG